jgi:hypothetical protein
VPVTESLSTAVLVKEIRKRLGLTQVQASPSSGGVVSVCQPLGTEQDQSFADSSQAD